MWRLVPLLFILGCDPYHAWPEPGTAFPYRYTEQDPDALEAYEHVRWETETWTPSTDLESAALYLLKAHYHRLWAPDETLFHFGRTRGGLPPLNPDHLTISFVGDVMWTGGGWADTYTEVADLLGGDIRVGNLETPTSVNHPTGQGDLGLYSFNASTEMLEGLPLDVVQLNNNHTLDATDEGLDLTLAELESRGIEIAGIDHHLVLDVAGTNVAFLAYTWGLNEPDAPTEHELFIIPFGHLDEKIALDRVGEDVDEAVAAGAQLVVALVHWGFEYEYYADPHFMVLGRQLLAEGVDIVVGTGPHVVEPPEWCAINIPAAIPGVGQCSLRSRDGRARFGAILYSLGNFGTVMPTIQAETGIIATVSLYPGFGVTGMGWEAVSSVGQNEGEKLFSLASLVEDGNEYEAEEIRLNQHLGTAWKR
jgi:poly-gamma-glutamate synthesis protein (capsule biosynthesis protein)